MKEVQEKWKAYVEQKMREQEAKFLGFERCVREKEAKKEVKK